jgi:glycosyltransferase involved in cell wall biosynthesis
VTVVRNGVPVERLAADYKKRDFALALGRICPEKGFHLALDAARDAGMKLLLAGELFGYPDHQSYFAREIRPRLDRDRRYIGQVGFGAKRRLLTQARCLLAPSLVPETASLVAMEALACGTPVVAVARGGILDVVEDGRHGVLYPDWEGPTALCDAIDKARRIGFNALDLRDRAESFSVSRFTDRMRTLLSRRIPS